MPAIFRNRFVWIFVAVFVLGGGGFMVMSGQAKARKAAEAKAAAAAPPSPYVAVGAGKADVEGGIIQVAARTAGVVQEVYVHEGDEVQPGGGH